MGLADLGESSGLSGNTLSGISGGACALITSVRLKASELCIRFFYSNGVLIDIELEIDS